MVQQNNRRKREKRAIDEINQSDIQYMLNYFDNRCVYCNVRLTRQEGYDNTLHIDHYRSLSEQDIDDDLVLVGLTVNNSLPSCRECNLKKKDTNPEQWIRSYCPNADEVLERIEFYFCKQQENIFL